MSEIVVHQSDFRKFVSERISLLYVGLKTFGKQFDGSALQAWLIVLSAKKITPTEISMGVEHFLTNERNLPMPGEFAAWVCEQRTAWEAKALIEATYQNELAKKAAYRQSIVDQGMNPDALISTTEAFQMLDEVAGQVNGRKALPDSSTWADPQQEAKIREQVSGGLK